MTWESRVPAVLDALVSLWGAVPELADIVLDGPIPVDSAAMEALSVGDDDDDDGISTEGLLSAEGMGSRPDREQFTVSCVIAVMDGANDMRAARLRAFDLLSAAAEALATNRTLGGVVMRAHVQGLSLRQLQTNGGALARVLFTVACDGYTLR